MKIAGIDLGGTTIKFGIFDDDLRILHKWSCPTPAKASDAAARIAAEISPFGPDVIGISAAGTVAGGLVTANNLSWTDEPLAALVHEAVGLPTTIINDGHAALQAELHGGALQGVQTGLLLTLGTGIGGGIVLNGQCWLSPTGLAPELGHTITHADGLTCSCGQCGCYEKYASATALRRMADGEEPVELIGRAKRGDADAKGIFARYVREVCIGIVSLNSIFAPEVVVLGGGISGAGNFLLDACRNALLPLHPTTIPMLRLARFGNTAGIIGAAQAAVLSAV